MTKLAIFASGKGSNAEAIIRFFAKKKEVAVALIICTHPKAGVLDVAMRHGIPAEVITQNELHDPEKMLRLLKDHKVNFIALAGFIWLVPQYLLKAFQGKVINIHPALLPEHGGKGMYGKKVHEAVLNASDKETGFTIHYVNERFDEGEIIFQAKCAVEPSDDAASLAAKVQKLEHLHYPRVIGELVKTKETVTHD